LSYLNSRFKEKEYVSVRAVSKYEAPRWMRYKSMSHPNFLIYLSLPLPLHHHHHQMLYIRVLHISMHCIISQFILLSKEVNLIRNGTFISDLNLSSLVKLGDMTKLSSYISGKDEGAHF
jgi:hypothetical protein